MKRYTLYILVLLMAVLCGCADASAEKGASSSKEGQNSSSENISSENASASDEKVSFYALVVEENSDFGGILVTAEDETIASPIVVHSENMPELSVGDRVMVRYNGQIALSYPGQIFGAEVTLANE